MNRLTIIGSVNPFGGYGRHLIRAARDIEALADTLVIIRPLKTHPDAPQWIQERTVNEVTGVHWELIIAPPTVCPTPGKRTVYFTMNETTRLTEQNVALLNKADHVIVPNQWNKECFLASGVSKPIHIVPLGIDHRIFNWRPLPPPSPVVFGTAGSGARKGIPDVIKAFLEAFPGRNDVRLRIKITTEDESPDVVDQRIDVVRSCYSDAEMADWYASLHCFVSASRGEGWGLMQQESCAMGRGLASASLPGMSWTEKTPSGRLADAPPPYVGQWHAGPDPRSFKMVLQDAVSDFQLRGIVSNTNAEQFTWDRSSAELIRVLTEVGAIVSKNPFLTLDDLPFQNQESEHKSIIEEISPFQEFCAQPFGPDAGPYKKALGVGGGDGDRPGLARAERPPECVRSSERDVARIKQLPAPPKYYHSGNLGDIIYGLYAMREHCDERGAELIIGPCQHQTGAHSLKAPITKQQFDMLLPLLKTQKWIKRVRWSQFYPMAEDVHDMNGFRKLWPIRHTMGIKTLCEAQFDYLGIRERFDPAHAWLDLQPSWQGTNLPRVVIHRSARWRQDDQMWRKLVNAYREKLLFVGTADEYFEFENTYGAVSFWKVRDFLEMAEIITFAIGFVGNQSFPMAMAIGFGQNVFQEQSLATPDCTFDRPGTFWTQKDDVRAVVKGWME